MIFYRFYNDFLTIPVLFQTNNMGDLGSSINSLFMPADLLLAVDIVILIWLYKRQPVKAGGAATRKERAAYFLLSPPFSFQFGRIGNRTAAALDEIV